MIRIFIVSSIAFATVVFVHGIAYSKPIRLEQKTDKPMLSKSYHEEYEQDMAEYAKSRQRFFDLSEKTIRNDRRAAGSICSGC